MELQGEKAIVTGGSGGFGAGIARALARRGAKVWITGRDEVALNRIADETGAVPVVADVTSGADWDRLFSFVGDDVRQRGFSQPRRAAEQNVIEGLIPFFGGTDE